MKIYYEVESSGDDRADSLMMPLYEKYKFEMMWILRDLEKEMNEENGMVIITPTWGVRTRGFSQELTDKIGNIIHNSNFPTSIF